MKRFLLSLISLSILAGCQSTGSNPSESFYTRSEAMSAQNVARCRVLEARRVTIGAEDLRSQSTNRYARAAGQPEQQIGTAIGAILGGVVGSEINDDFGTAIGATVGGVIGNAQGTRMAQRRMAQPGVEYSVLLAGGQERIIAQHLNAGDRIAAPGSTCRIAQGPNGQRVLPGAHLPSTVNRPRQTTFAN